RVQRRSYSRNSTDTIQKVMWWDLVNDLLRSRAELPWGSTRVDGQPVLRAWRAYDSGREALDRWDLPEAESAFRQALTLQPTLVPARIWLAQTMMWVDKRARANDVRPLLAALAPDILRSKHADSLQAVGLLNLANGQFHEACALFSALGQSDSTNL